jgi:hypothetical protein
VSEERAGPVGVATLLVGLVAFAGYALACAPAAYLLDSGELAAAAFGLGIAHPPGEPLAALWGKLFSLLPLGSVAFRVALGQAAAGALAVMLLFRLALRSFSRLGDGGNRAVPILVAVAVAWGFAFAPGVTIVADRPEVYALETVLALAGLSCALRTLDQGDPRFLLLAAGLIGLGLGTHPLIAGLTGAGMTLAALPCLRAHNRVRLVGLSFALLGAGALVLAYLPVRASALFALAAAGADTIAWGDARTPAGLAWVLTAATFAAKSQVVHTAAASPLELPFFFMQELEPALAVLAPIGAFVLLRRPGGRLLLRSPGGRLPAVVVLAVAAGSIGAAMVAGLDPANPDVRGYLGVSIALAALLAGAAVIAGLIPLARSARRAWLAPALAGLLAGGALTRFPAGGAYPGLRHAAAADVFVGRMLAELPPRAALLTSHVESAFLVGYQRMVEGRRPDVAWAHLGFVRGPGYAERLRVAEPDLGPVLAAHREAPLSFSAVFALDRRRPVRLEVDEHLAPNLRGPLVPAGLTWRLGPTRAGATDVLAAPDAWMLGEARGDRQVRGYFAWRSYNDALVACHNGLVAAARSDLGVLTTLLPEDRRVLSLREHCSAVPASPGQPQPGGREPANGDRH